MKEHHQEAYCLTKLPHSKLKILEMVISNYIMGFNPVEYTNTKKKDLSIIISFWHKELKNKINKQFPSKTCKVKFFYHEALVMVDAFVKFQTDTFCLEEHHYTNSIIEILKTDLHRQIS